MTFGFGDYASVPPYPDLSKVVAHANDPYWRLDDQEVEVVWHDGRIRGWSMRHYADATRVNWGWLNQVNNSIKTLARSNPDRWWYLLEDRDCPRYRRAS